jgi:hypothetical protein
MSVELPVGRSCAARVGIVGPIEMKVLYAQANRIWGCTMLANQKRLSSEQHQIFFAAV